MTLQEARNELAKEIRRVRAIDPDIAVDNDIPVWDIRCTLRFAARLLHKMKAVESEKLGAEIRRMNERLILPPTD